MIKKWSLIALFALFPVSIAYAQTTVFAYVKDEKGNAIERAEIDLKESENDVTADKIGYFQFVGLNPGRYQIIVYKGNYETKVVEFEVSGEKRKDLGNIILNSAFGNEDQGLTLLDNNNGDDENSGQSTVGLLQSSRDIFNRIAGYDLGFYWFRPRGNDGRQSEMMFNGVSMAKSDNGSVDFSNWGGLNEITRYPEIATNHTPSEYAFGGVNSVIYKNTKASEYRKGSQLTYSLTNRNYSHRLSYRYTSGMNKNGWAFTGMLARRWAQEGIQEGTFYDAYAAYLGVEKKINDAHTLTLNVIGSPYSRSTASPSTQEVYDYRGIHYNSYWGWQDGEKRSERVRRGFQPLIQLTDYWKINKKTNLWTTLSYQFGKDRGSRLDWQNVPNPSPTYYRNMPSYFTTQDGYNASLQDWLNGNPEVTQINWARLYDMNTYRNTPQDHYGVYGKNARYFLVDDVNDDKIWNLSTHLAHQLNDKTRFIINISYQNYRSDQYREVKDLLGADFALNIDPFADQKKSGLLNEGEANVTKKVGDRISYDYTFARQEVKINPGVKFSTGNFDVFVTGLLGYSTSYREGKYNHYLYKDALGKSKNYDFTNYGLKGQIIYKLNGRNFLVYNGAYYSQAPFMEDLFFNPRINASVVPGIRNTIVNANDLSYVISTPFLKARLSGYIINTDNDVNVLRFFVDGIRTYAIGEDGNVQGAVASTFVTQVMPNVSKRNMGLELGIDVKATSTLSFQGLASLGEYTFRNNPDLYFGSNAAAAVNDNGFYYLGKTNISNYKQGGTPQTAFSAGFRYSSPKYWWFGANWNYFDHSYLDPAAMVRTEAFVQNPVTGTPYLGLVESDLRRVLQQKQLPSSFFVNANAGKSWVLGKYYLLLTATVNNVLNNKKYITGGFEQTREASYPDFAADLNKQYPPFAPKYWYSQGRSYFINVQFRF